MTYIENIFICIAIPMLLSVFFVRGPVRRFTIFVIIGMGVCLMSAYVNSFFVGIYRADSISTAVEITPICEEVMKLLPLLFFFLIFEPKESQLPDVAIAIAVGFATFENVCYLTEHGADNMMFLLIRGISAGALHILCGIFMGFGISYVFRYRWLALTGTVGLLGACIGLHGIYNLLIAAKGTWRFAGCLFPSLLILCLFIGRQAISKMDIWNSIKAEQPS